MKAQFESFEEYMDASGKVADYISKCKEEQRKLSPCEIVELVVNSLTIKLKA